jgi:HSP20 family protein
MADRTNQQGEDKASRGTGRPSQSATEPGNRTQSTSTSTPAPGDRGIRSNRTDQERALQTGRESASSTGLSRRPQTAPVYGPGRGEVSPFGLMRRISEDMDRLFQNFGFGRTGLGLLPTFGSDDRDLWRGGSAFDQAAWTPQVETFRRGDKLVFRADLPGLKKEDVKVEIDDGVLAISGERREEREEDRDDYYRSERTYGQFYRAIPLPEGVSDDRCEASFKDGVLEVSLPAPKEEKRTAKQIQVK